jgi:hypothetical protein
MDDVVLDQGEAHVDVFPISSPDVRIEEELFADDIGRGDYGRFW